MGLCENIFHGTNYILIDFFSGTFLDTSRIVESTYILNYSRDLLHVNLQVLLDNKIEYVEAYLTQTNFKFLGLKAASIIFLKKYAW